MKPSAFQRLSRRHGSIVRNDLVPEHLSRAAWYRAHDSGLLTSIHPGVARLTTAHVTPLMTVEAALAATPDSMAGGLAAAWLWGASLVEDVPIEVLVEARRHPGSLAGVILHRPTDKPRRVPVKGLCACEPMRATLDVAAWHPERVGDVMAELVVAGRYDFKTMQAALERARRRGRPGVTALERALRDWKLGDRPPDSLLERTMAELIARHGLPPAAFHHRIGRYEVDFAYIAERAAVECDGWGNHGRTSKQYDADRDREADLSGDGWAVWRYTWTQITHRAGWVASTLRRRLTARRAELGLPALPD